MMVVKPLVRYSTSFIGALFHTIGGLAVILALPVLALFVVFAAPSFIGELGVNGLFSGTVTEVVAELRAETPASTLRFGLALLGLIGVYMFSQRVGYLFYDIGKSTATSSGTSQETSKTAASSETTEPTPEEYLSKFGGLSFIVAGIFGVITIILVTIPDVIPRAIIVAFGSGSLQFLFLLLTLGYGIAGYSAYNQWAEGVLLGCGIYLLNLISSVINIQPLGILIGGLGLNYGLRGIWGTNFVLLESDMEQINDTVGTKIDNIRESLPIGTTATPSDDSLRSDTLEQNTQASDENHQSDSSDTNHATTASDTASEPTKDDNKELSEQ